jgi:hypothetical protein
MSLPNLLHNLRKLDETTLLELLEITSDDLVDAFLEKIEERLDFLYDQAGEQEDHA